MVPSAFSTTTIVSMEAVPATATVHDHVPTKSAALPVPFESPHPTPRAAPQMPAQAHEAETRMPLPPLAALVTRDRFLTS
jgi:hypothetical protein